MENRPPPTTVYKHQAKTYLFDLFPRISCRAIGIVFQTEAFSFPSSFRILLRIQDADQNDIGTVFAFDPTIKVFILKDRIKKNIEITDRILLAELADIDELANEKENGPAATKKEEDKNDANADEIGSLLECGCCFGEHSPEVMVQCSAHSDHLVCQECLYNHVSEQVDGKNTPALPCIIVHNCIGEYQAVQLDKFLSPKLKRRFHERKFLAELSDSGMTDVWTCQKCNYKGFLGDPKPKTVYCPQCLKVYCTECHKIQHEDKTCKEAEQDRVDDVYRRAAEAMTKATVRRCPNKACKKEFQKLDGCNKMKCFCGTLSCYLCGMDITEIGYAHFCKKHDCGCRKCHLWAKYEAQDRQARHAAGRKVLEDAGVKSTEIDKFLASPTAKKSGVKDGRQVANRPIPLQVAQPLPPGNRPAMDRNRRMERERALPRRRNRRAELNRRVALNRRAELNRQAAPNHQARNQERPDQQLPQDDDEAPRRNGFACIALCCRALLACLGVHNE